jgi:hypothetical protein
VKDLQEKKENRQRGERASPAKWKRIQERAGELAMNRGKGAHEADKKEMQRAKRELLDMQISSPQKSRLGPLQGSRSTAD